MRLLAWVVFSLQPLHYVEVAGAVQGDGILVEEIWHEDEVAVCCELVGDELGIIETMADYVGDASVDICVSMDYTGVEESTYDFKVDIEGYVHEDTIFSALVFRVFRVDLEVTELGELAGRLALVRDAFVAAGSWWMRSHFRSLFLEILLWEEDWTKK